MVSELSLDWPYLGRKNIKIDQNCDFNDFLFFFRPWGGLDIIWTQYWDNIWNPLIKANLLDLQYESGIEHLFFYFPQYFENFVSCANKKKVFLWEKDGIVLIFTSHWLGISFENLEKVSSVKMKRPYEQCLIIYFVYKFQCLFH